MFWNQAWRFEGVSFGAEALLVSLTHFMKAGASRVNGLPEDGSEDGSEDASVASICSSDAIYVVPEKLISDLLLPHMARLHTTWQ